MRALHVTYRFGEEIVGGAELHLQKLTEALARKGVEIDVLTTTARNLHTPVRFGAFWENYFPAGYDRVGSSRVIRCRVFNLPKLFFGTLCYGLQKRWNREEWEGESPEALCPPQEGMLGRGWYHLESYESGRFRWTQREAEFFIRDYGITQISFSAFATERMRGELCVNGAHAGNFEAEQFPKRFTFDLAPARDAAPCRIQLARTTRPGREVRPLGIAVSELSWIAGGVEKSLPLTSDYKTRLLREPDKLLEMLHRRALARPHVYSWIFNLLQGPLSPGMISYLLRKTKNYDVVLAANLPFNTVGYATHYARRAGVPIAVMALAHLDDEYYHWRHYYKHLANADIVLANSQYSEEIFAERWGIRAEYVGPGVDEQEFLSEKISGERFRKQFGLQGVPFVLYVGRKSQPKRYDVIVRAMDIVNKTLRCKFVIIGPDQDKQPIQSDHTLYLGGQSRNAILDAYDACDVFAMMSESESFGMVFPEAWMRKKPVIGNRYCRPVASQIRDGEDGFLCGDEREVAERVVQLLRDPALAQRLGSAGYEKTIRTLTWDRLADKVYAIYQRIAAERGKENGNVNRGKI